jgi:hypothetical protein
MNLEVLNQRKENQASGPTLFNQLCKVEPERSRSSHISNEAAILSNQSKRITEANSLKQEEVAGSKAASQKRKRQDE